MHANLNENIHQKDILLTRCRCWILHNGFSTKLDAVNQTHFGKLKSGETVAF